MPTLTEINAVSQDVPVFILNLYNRALLNGAALRALGIDRNTLAPPDSVIEKDSNGNPTGMLIAKPNATILYAAIAQRPKLGLEDQLNSTRHYLQEMNRLGITRVIDAGGGGQNYPDDYQIMDRLHQAGEMAVRVAYNLFTQNPGEEKADFKRWIEIASPGQGDDFYRLNGAGEMLVFSAADFEDFTEPRPSLNPNMEGELTDVIKLLSANKWPFRLHATYDESISRFLDVFENVNQEIPFAGMHWILDHAETISDRNIERVKALGGGIAIQHRMAFQGEYFIDLYGIEAATHTPPIKKIMAIQHFIENSLMTHLILQGKNDFEPEVIPQTDSLHDSNVNHALIAIAQEVAELLKQSYPVQADGIDNVELIRELYICLKPELIQHVAEASDIDPKQFYLVPSFGQQDRQLHRIGMLLLAELCSGNIMGQLYVESLTQVLVIHLLRHYSTLARPIPLRNDSLTHVQAQQVVDYIWKPSLQFSRNI